MKDYRNDIIQAVKLQISQLEGKIQDSILSALSDALDPFEIIERSTAIVPVPTANEVIMKIYCNSLFLDGKSNQTIYQYSRQLTRFVDFIKNADLKTVSTYNIRHYLAQQKVNGLSPTTIDNMRSYISSFYSWLTSEGYIESNPCSAVRPIKTKMKKEARFSAVEIDSLRNACENLKERAVLEFFLSSGVRVGKLVNLKLEDIDFNSNSVHIVHGKGDKERYTYIDSLTKSYLVKYLSSENIDCGFLFQNHNHQQFTTAGIRYILNSIAKRCKINNVHPHRFRRTFASNLRLRGMEITEIKELLGHSSIETTMVYLDIDDKTTKTSYDKCVA